MTRTTCATVLCVCLMALGAGVHAQGDAQAVTSFFLKYRAVYEKSQKVEDVLPYWVKERVADVQKTPKAERDKMFEMMKAFDDARNVKVTKATKVSDAEYSLDVAGTNAEKKAVKGTVTILKEAGAWKVGAEKWSE
jgi:hypothetical protein